MNPSPNPALAAKLRRSAHLCLRVVVASLAFLPAARAQLFPPEDEEFSNSAFVRVSDDLRTLLYTAGRSAREGDVGSALHALQAILNQHGRDVVELSDRTFVSGFDAVSQQMSAMGAEGRSRYEDLFGQSARDALARHRGEFDVDGLLAIAERYPFAEVVTQALQSAATLSAERAEWIPLQNAVLALMRRGEARAVDVARLATALLQLEDEAGLAALERRLGPLREQSVRVGDAAPSLGGLIDGYRALLVPASRQAALDKLRRGEVRVEAMAQLPFGEGTLGPREPPDPRRFNQIPGIDPIDGVIVGQQVFVCGQLGLYAIGLAPGVAEVDPKLTFANDFGKSNYSTVGNRSLRPTFVDGTIYLPYVDRRPYERPRIDHGQLIAVDAAAAARGEMAESFRIYTQLATQPDELRDYVFEGPAVAYGDLLILSGSRLRAQTECALFAFRRDGSLVWSTHLASAADVERYESRNQPSDPRRAPPSPVSIKGGVVYCVTNLGVAAAVDAWTGRVRWLFRYNRIRPDAMETYDPKSLYDTRGWMRGAPHVWAESVILAPEDSRYLYVLAREPGRNGELRLQDPLGKAEREALVAADEETGALVFLARETTAPSRDRPYFSKAEISRAGVGYENDQGLLFEERLVGTPLLVGQTLYASTNKGLRLYDLNRGLLCFKAISVPDDLLSAREEQYFGNLSLCGDQILSVSPNFVVRIVPD